MIREDLVKTSYRWWALFRGNFYAANFDFDNEVTEDEARKYIISWLKQGTWRLNRLPAGTEIWAGKI
jgi:hypothetical protein